MAKKMKITVVTGLPDKSKCCGASIAIDQDTFEPYCKKCFKTV